MIWCQPLKAAHILPSVKLGFLNKQERTEVEQACGATLIISLSIKSIIVLLKPEFNEILGVLKNIILHIIKIIYYFLKNIN